MGQNSHIDWELDEIIGNAIDGGWLTPNTSAHGIACKVSNEGISSLTARQRYVFDTAVMKALRGAQTYAERQRCKELVESD